MSERVYVDRVEGDRAVLVCGAEGAETVSIPARLLPPNTGEGAALDLTLSPAKDDPVKGEVEGLLDELFSDDSPQH
ncbi:MAG: DUF3006 domain-containing protein [Actinomycetota bacterium]